MQLESHLLVSHRPIHRSARLARGLSEATTLKRACKGPKSWICAQDTSSIPAERVYSSPWCLCELLLLQGISSPICHQWMTGPPPWEKTAPNLYAMLQHCFTHRKVPSYTLTCYKASFKWVPPSFTVHFRLLIKHAENHLSFLHWSKMDPHYAWQRVSLFSYALSQTTFGKPDRNHWQTCTCPPANALDANKCFNNKPKNDI